MSFWFKLVLHELVCFYIDFTETLFKVFTDCKLFILFNGKIAFLHFIGDKRVNPPTQRLNLKVLIADDIAWNLYNEPRACINERWKLPGNVFLFPKTEFPPFSPFTILCDRPRKFKALPFDVVIQKMRMPKQCYCFDIFSACTNRIFLDCINDCYCVGWENFHEWFSWSVHTIMIHASKDELRLNSRSCW